MACNASSCAGMSHRGGRRAVAVRTTSACLSSAMVLVSPSSGWLSSPWFCPLSWIVCRGSMPWCFSAWVLGHPRTITKLSYCRGIELSVELPLASILTLLCRKPAFLFFQDLEAILQPSQFLSVSFCCFLGLADYFTTTIFLIFYLVEIACTIAPFTHSQPWKQMATQLTVYHVRPGPFLSYLPSKGSRLVRLRLGYQWVQPPVHLQVCQPISLLCSAIVVSTANPCHPPPF